MEKQGAKGITQVSRDNYCNLRITEKAYKTNWQETQFRMRGSRVCYLGSISHFASDFKGVSQLEVDLKELVNKLINLYIKMNNKN